MFLISLLFFKFIFFDKSTHYNIKLNVSFSALSIIALIFYEHDVFVNSSYFSYKNNFDEINTLLLNNLSIIHPILTQVLYSIFIFTAIVLTMSRKSMNVLNFNNFNSARFLNIRVYFFLEVLKIYAIKLIYLILVLGGWWSSQELTWNNWWSWDAIELTSVIFLIIILKIVHLLKSRVSLVFLIELQYKLTYYSIVFYFFVRYDLSSSLHSFNSFEFVELYFF